MVGHEKMIVDHYVMFRAWAGEYSIGLPGDCSDQNLCQMRSRKGDRCDHCDHVHPILASSPHSVAARHGCPLRRHASSCKLIVALDEKRKVSF